MLNQPTIQIVVTENTGTISFQDQTQTELPMRSLIAPHEPHISPHSNNPTSTAVQIEGFLVGAGYQLPVMGRLKEANYAHDNLKENYRNRMLQFNKLLKNHREWLEYAGKLELMLQKKGVNTDAPNFQRNRPDTLGYGEAVTE